MMAVAGGKLRKAITTNTHPTTPPRGGEWSQPAEMAESGEAVDVESVAAGDGADDVVVT